MKRTILCLLALCLLLVACAAVGQSPAQRVEHTYPGFPGAPETFDGMTEVELQSYFELAQETLKRYILVARFPEGAHELPQFPLQMTPPLQKYTQLRFDNDTRHESPKELLDITTGMGDGWWVGGSSWQVIKGKLLCAPTVEAAFRYPGMDTDSGFGMGVQMLIENPQNPTLVDWFDPDKGSWDRQVREAH